MSDWKETALAQICQIKGGKRLPAGSEFAEGITPFPYLRVTDMINGTIDTNSLVYVKLEIEPYIKNYKISKNDLYVTIAGTLGLFGSIPEILDNAQLTENAAKLCEIDTKRFNKDFLKYYLNSSEIQTQISREIGVGGGVPKLALFRIAKLNVKHPELPEQCRIAKILTTNDAAIEKTQAAIAKYKAIKQGMLHDLFTRGIDLNTGRLRPKYEDAPELYKESKLGWVPREWEVEELMNYLSFISYGFTNPMPETKDGPYLITAANVNYGKIQYDTCRKTSNEAFDTLLTEKSRPKRSDILLTKDGTLGRIALVEKENLCINQSVAVLRPNKLINPLYLKILLESPFYQKTMLDEAGGSTIKHIYITIVDKMPIGVPQNIDEQKEIAQRLKTIEMSIETEQNYLQKLQAIKQGLMGDLLSGRKRITVKDESLTYTENQL